MVKAFFNNIRQHIAKELLYSEIEIKVAVCWFTSKELFDMLCYRLTKGVKVELIVLNDSINNKVGGLDFQKFVDLGGLLYFSDLENPMHNKYCIVDGATLINGSYNWTNFAEVKNNENILIINDDFVIKDFLSDFEKLKENCVNVLDVKSVANTDSSQISIIEDVKLAGINDIVLKDRDLEVKQLRKVNTNIGEKLHNDDFFNFIPKGSLLPFSKTHTLTTVFDNQLSCVKDIRFGESLIGSLNTQIGFFTINDLPPLPKGTIGFITSFQIDEFGVLCISTEVRETNKRSIYRFDVKNLIE